MMHRAAKLKIIDLNEHLICRLCKGYFIDATTIIECLHSFCRSCIVKYLETNKYCPVCDVQVHKTKPLLNIRPDRTLQDIVYKLVPRLYQNEVQRRRDFLTQHPETIINFQQYLEHNQHLYILDESISIVLYYYGCKERTQRYLRCPAGVTIGHLEKLIRAKYNLSDHLHYVDILYINNNNNNNNNNDNNNDKKQEQQKQQIKENCLHINLSLMDIAYIYKWTRKTPLELCYRIYEYLINCNKKPKFEQIGNNNNNNNSDNNSSNNWKEVQLRISENGEMSITGIQDENLELLHKNNNNNNNNNNNSKKVSLVETKTNNTNTNNNNNNNNKKELPELRSIKNDLSIAPVSTTATTTTTTTTTVYSTINQTKCSVIEDETKSPPKLLKKSTINETKGCKRKLDTINNDLLPPPPIKQSKQQQQQTILNHTLNVNNLSNNHPLKKHSLIVGNKIGDCENNVKLPITVPTTTTTTTKPCYMPKTTPINLPKTNINHKETSKTVNNNNIGANNNNNNNNNKLIKSKASTPIGYKTLRDPPKSWNSQISKANLLLNKPVDNPKFNNNNNNNNNNNTNNNNNNTSNSNDLKNVRPAKFFKMRNNLPRYLGNPASGVKPMYQLHNTSPDKDKINLTTTTTTTNSTGTVATISGNNNNNNNSEIRKHSIVKIDPKTLKPITEKASDITSLVSTTITTTAPSPIIMSDLKINTSSVSIFNPLKLQNSPKLNNCGGGGGGGGGSNGERRSPKSPHSPKLLPVISSSSSSSVGILTTATTTISSSTSSSSSSSGGVLNKRDNKLNLNFTPSNPFIPNLQSPTMNPNQFLYPTTQTVVPTHGFPPYDPRFMAAYHSLLYSRQRMAFPPTGLNLDISGISNNSGGGGGGNCGNNNNGQQQQQQQQKKNFELAPISPKLSLNQQQSNQSQDNQASPVTTAITTIATTTTTTTSSTVNSTKTTSTPISTTITTSSSTTVPTSITTAGTTITTTATTTTTTATTTRLSTNKTHINSTLKRNKETTNKNEKSLQSAVEKLKLTQNNRAKEAANNQTTPTTGTTTTTTTTTTKPTTNKKDEPEKIQTKTNDNKTEETKDKEIDSNNSDNNRETKQDDNNDKKIDDDNKQNNKFEETLDKQIKIDEKIVDKTNIKENNNKHEQIEGGDGKQQKNDEKQEQKDESK